MNNTKTISIIATILALLTSVIASYGWVVYIDDSNLLITITLFLPILGGLVIGIVKLRKESFKASIIYSLINFLFSGLVYYIVLTS